MYNSASKTKGSPSPKGVLFYDQFAGNYLQPYGKAKPPPDTETILKWLYPKLCEWLGRPKVAMSEFAETMTYNMALLSEEPSPFLNNSAFEAVKSHMGPMLEACKNLNTRNQRNASKEDIKAVLEEIYDPESNLHSVMAEMFEIGNAMYTTAIQYIATKEMLTKPDYYDDHLVADDTAAKTFKKERQYSRVTS